MRQQLEISPRDYHTRLTLDRSNLLSPDSWLSKSRLWELKDSSLFRWRQGSNEFKGSPAADHGSVIDCLLTTPEEIDDLIAVHDFDSFRTKEAREFRDEAKENGKILLTLEELEEKKRIAERVMKSPAGDIIRSSRKQVVLLGRIKGIQCKALVDLAPEGSEVLVDLKTTNDLSLSGISKTIAKFGYHVQAGFYLHLWNQQFPDDQRQRFQFIWQQSTAPYEVAITELPAFDIDAGEQWAANQIDRLLYAHSTNRWPNICNNQIAVVGRPSWAAMQDEEDMDGPVFAPR